MTEIEPELLALQEELELNAKSRRREKPITPPWVHKVIPNGFKPKLIPCACCKYPFTRENLPGVTTRAVLSQLQSLWGNPRIDRRMEIAGCRYNEERICIMCMQLPEMLIRDPNGKRASTMLDTIGMQIRSSIEGYTGSLSGTMNHTTATIGSIPVVQLTRDDVKHVIGSSCDDKVALEYVVDGVINKDRKFCVRTLTEFQPWIQVELAASTTINRVIVTCPIGGADGIMPTIRFYIFISILPLELSKKDKREGIKELQAAKRDAEVYKMFEFQRNKTIWKPPAGTVGRYIRVQLVATAPLIMAQLQVFGAPLGLKAPVILQAGTKLTVDVNSDEFNKPMKSMLDSGDMFEEVSDEASNVSVVDDTAVHATTSSSPPLRLPRSSTVHAAGIPSTAASLRRPVTSPTRHPLVTTRLTKNLPLKDFESKRIPASVITSAGSAGVSLNVTQMFLAMAEKYDADDKISEEMNGLMRHFEADEIAALLGFYAEAANSDCLYSMRGMRRKVSVSATTKANEYASLEAIPSHVVLSTTTPAPTKHVEMDGSNIKVELREKHIRNNEHEGEIGIESVFGSLRRVPSGVLKDMRLQFEQLDLDNRGTVSHRDFKLVVSFLVEHVSTTQLEEMISMQLASSGMLPDGSVEYAYFMDLLDSKMSLIKTSRHGVTASSSEADPDAAEKSHHADDIERPREGVAEAPAANPIGGRGRCPSPERLRELSSKLPRTFTPITNFTPPAGRRPLTAAQTTTGISNSPLATSSTANDAGLAASSDCDNTMQGLKKKLTKDKLFGNLSSRKSPAFKFVRQSRHLQSLIVSDRFEDLIVSLVSSADYNTVLEHHDFIKLIFNNRLGCLRCQCSAFLKTSASKSACDCGHEAGFHSIVGDKMTKLSTMPHHSTAHLTPHKVDMFPVYPPGVLPFTHEKAEGVIAFNGKVEGSTSHHHSALGDAASITRVKCGLCEEYFNQESFLQRVSFKAICDLRKHWGLDVLDMKYASRMYDSVRICLYCEQFFTWNVDESLSALRGFNDIGLKLLGGGVKTAKPKAGAGRLTDEGVLPPSVMEWKNTVDPELLKAKPVKSHLALLKNYNPSSGAEDDEGNGERFRSRGLLGSNGEPISMNKEDFVFKARPRTTASSPIIKRGSSKRGVVTSPIRRDRKPSSCTAPEAAAGRDGESESFFPSSSITASASHAHTGSEGSYETVEIVEKAVKESSDETVNEAVGDVSHASNTDVVKAALSAAEDVLRSSSTGLTRDKVPKKKGKKKLPVNVTHELDRLDHFDVATGRKTLSMKLPNVRSARFGGSIVNPDAFHEALDSKSRGTSHRTTGRSRGEGRNKLSTPDVAVVETEEEKKAMKLSERETEKRVRAMLKLHLNEDTSVGNLLKDVGLELQSVAVSGVNDMYVWQLRSLKQEKEEIAAVRIQSAWRGLLGRRLHRKSLKACDGRMEDARQRRLQAIAEKRRKRGLNDERITKEYSR